ncbi:hypothetical protein NMG29_09665 [Streptomyces cocklensis]|nr:hypothetical protein [Actinacidiphila cocklensis]WSX75311.1 hypothetical protein OH826_16240 [Streptomyces sp. NBC_00899]
MTCTDEAFGKDSPRAQGESGETDAAADSGTWSAPRRVRAIRERRPATRVSTAVRRGHRPRGDADDAGSLAQIASIDAADQPADDTWRALSTRNATRLLPHLA